MFLVEPKLVGAILWLLSWAVGVALIGLSVTTGDLHWQTTTLWLALWKFSSDFYRKASRLP